MIGYHSYCKGLLYLLCFLSSFCWSAPSTLIAIDVGHSTLHPGAISARGIPEFQFNLGIERVVNKTLMDHGVKTLIIGDDGNMVDLKKRTATANERDASFFLSLHHDSAQPKYFESWIWNGKEQKFTDHFSGFSIFISRKNPHITQSLDCARALGIELKKQGFHPTEHHAENIAGENREWADKNNGVYYYDDLVVLKTANMPAMLLESGVIINRNEELVLQKNETRQKIADSILSGLTSCHVIPQ